MTTTEAITQPLTTEQIIDLVACPNVDAYQAGYAALTEGVRTASLDPGAAYDTLSDAADEHTDLAAQRRLGSGMIALMLGLTPSIQRPVEALR